MTLPFQTTLRWAIEADFGGLADVMFAAVREGDSPYTEAQRQAWVLEPRRGEAWRTRILSQEIIVAEADGRLLGFMSLAEGGYIEFSYIRAEARGAGLLLRGPHRSPFGLRPCRTASRGLHSASCSSAS
jgi:putative acetyltransferase